MKTRKLLGSLLKEARKSKGLTQSQLAKQLECSSQYVSKLELGINLSFESLDRFLDVLELNLNVYTSEKEINNNI